MSTFTCYLLTKNTTYPHNTVLCAIYIIYLYTKYVRCTLYVFDEAYYIYRYLDIVLYFVWLRLLSNTRTIEYLWENARYLYQLGVYKFDTTSSKRSMVVVLNCVRLKIVQMSEHSEVLFTAEK